MFTMGLTLNYRIRAREDVADSDIPSLVVAMRERALAKLAPDLAGKVSEIGGKAEDLFWQNEWLQVPAPDEGNTVRGVEVAPIEGHVFGLNLGAGCEPMWLGLCRYPEQVTDAVTGKLMLVQRRGWRLSCSCKTQYSSLHGWENFRRIHIAAVELLAEIKTLGIEVEIDDEGGYWPDRDIAELRRRIDRMNGLTAALAGALKDEAEEGNASALQAPILAHPDFERLEAEAISNEKDKIAEAVNLLKKQRPSDDDVT